MRNPDRILMRRAVVACSLSIVAGCASAGDVVYRADSVGPTTSRPVDTSASIDDLIVVPTLPDGSGADLPAEQPVGEEQIVIDRLWSPRNAVAEVSGRGATTADLITVDDELADVRRLSIEEDGSFVAEIAVADEGAHTVCVRDVCGRVFVMGADAESIDDVEAKIDEAIPFALEAFDLPNELPGWTIDVAGPFAGLGGSTDSATKTVVVYANRDRSVNDFVTTLLHEFGHAIDAERLTESDRLAYLELRGIAADTPWRSDTDHTIEAWAGQPAEDFAEVMAAVWTNGALTPRTGDLAPAPDAETLAAVAALADV